MDTLDQVISSLDSGTFFPSLILKIKPGWVNPKPIEFPSYFSGPIRIFTLAFFIKADKKDDTGVKCKFKPEYY